MKVGLTQGLAHIPAAGRAQDLVVEVQGRRLHPPGESDPIY
jgi:hypothetical protein